MEISVRKIMVTLKIVSAQVMRILPISKSMESVIIVAEGVRQHVKQRCELQRERLQKKYLREHFGIEVRGFFKSNWPCESCAADHRRH